MNSRPFQYFKKLRTLGKLGGVVGWRRHPTTPPSVSFTWKDPNFMILFFYFSGVTPENVWTYRQSQGRVLPAANFEWLPPEKQARFQVSEQWFPGNSRFEEHPMPDGSLGFAGHYRWVGLTCGQKGVRQPGCAGCPLSLPKMAYL